MLLQNKFTTIKELLHFLWSQKLWWFIPFVLVLILIAGLLIFAQSSPIAPFLYTAF